MSPARRSARVPAPRAAAVRPTIRRDSAAPAPRVWWSKGSPPVFSRWCRGPSSAGAVHRQCFPRPSYAATARSSGRSSTCCAARAAACALARTRRNRRRKSRPPSAQRSPPGVAASSSCRSPTVRAGRRADRDRCAARHHRPRPATQTAWSGRANQRTPINASRYFRTDLRPALVYL